MAVVDAAAAMLELMPSDPPGLTLDELRGKVPRTTAQRAIDRLLSREPRVVQSGSGVRGDPHRFAAPPERASTGSNTSDADAAEPRDLRRRRRGMGHGPRMTDTPARPARIAFLGSSSRRRDSLAGATDDGLVRLAGWLAVVSAEAAVQEVKATHPARATPLPRLASEPGSHPPGHRR